MDRRSFLKTSAGLFIPAAPALILPKAARAQGGMGPGPGMVHSAGGVAGSVWGDHGTLVALSTTTTANDTAAPTNSSFTTVRGTQAYAIGKHYFEVKAVSAGSGFIIPGLIDATTPTGASMDNFILPNSVQNYSANGTSKNNGTGFGGVDIGSGWSLVNGDVMGVAFDAPNGFSYLNKNGVYFLSGDPTSGALGTGHVGAFTVAPSLYPAISIIIDGLWQLRTAAADLLHLPSGYTAWG